MRRKLLGSFLCRHFFFGRGLKVHPAGETRNVSIVQLVGSGERVEVVFPEVVEDHGCFLFLQNDGMSEWDGFEHKGDAAEMTRVVKVARGRSEQLLLLSLSALTPTGILRI